MQSEQRACQNCKQQFTIELEDFAFYEKMEVPPPTWCPECRLKRRMVFRNEMTLYKRKCDFTGETIFSGYSGDRPFKIYKRDVWYSDMWNPMKYGRDYDFSKPFFEQFRKLWQKVPIPNQNLLRTVNSDYCNNVSDLRDCYLLFNSELSENCAYGNGITSSKDVFDSYFMKRSERAYEGFVCIRSYNVFFSSNISNSHNIWFSRDLVGCSNCLGCVNLRNKQYMIFNEQYSPEGYFEKLKGHDVGSYKIISEVRQKAMEFILRFPVKYMYGRQNVNVSGDYITHSKNVHNSFFIDEFENCRFCFSMGLKPTKDCYDFCWGGAASFTYEAVSVGYQINQARFIFECWPGCFDIHYCVFCSSGCSHLFGCIGLRNKQYCILNKQYSKAEYERLVPKIIDHMNKMPYTDREGRVYKYGEFFPPELSPFSYNETIAHEYFPLTRKEAGAQGYSWKEVERREYPITMTSDQLPDHIRDVDDSILNEVIGCKHAIFGSETSKDCNEQCTQAFRIIPQELTFYKETNLPLPRLCPNCRHYQRLKQRNSLRLWTRRCQCGGKASTDNVQEKMNDKYIYHNTARHFHGNTPCPNEFETTYASQRAEIVYCEKCFLQEVA